MLLFATVMMIAAGAVAFTVIGVRYDTALEQQQASVVQIAHSRARLMEAVAGPYRYNLDSGRNDFVMSE